MRLQFVVGIYASVARSPHIKVSSRRAYTRRYLNYVTVWELWIRELAATLRISPNTHPILIATYAACKPTYLPCLGRWADAVS